MKPEVMLDILNRYQECYFAGSGRVRCRRGDKAVDLRDLVLYRIDEITFEDEAPRREALENVLSAVRIPEVNFVYLIVGSKEGVKFYYGLARNPGVASESHLSLKELGDNVLQDSLEGNFRGCRSSLVTPEEQTPLVRQISSMKYASRIEGVAGTIKDNEKFQSVDRLVDAMAGDTFCVMLVAEALQPEQIIWLEQTLQDAYNELAPLAKYSKQEGKSEGTSKSRSYTKSENESHSKGSNEGSSRSNGKNESKSRTTSNSTSETTSKTSSSQCNGTTKGGGTSSGTTQTESQSQGTSRSDTKGSSSSVSDQDGSNTSTSHTTSKEYMNRSAGDWIKYCDEVIFPRLDYGKGKGIFFTSFYVLTEKKTAFIKLENTVLALFSGKQGNRVPLRSFPITLNGSDEGWAVTHFQMPMGYFQEKPPEEEMYARAFLQQQVDWGSSFPLCSWVTTNELSMLAGLPQKEVIGMRLREEVEFGLNYKAPKKEDGIYLGAMVQNGREMKHAPVYLDKNVLDKHVFVAGVTGSGKTTTCQKILLESGLPFLVIEPAKTEYRILKQKEASRDVLIFTLGNDRVAPFRLNPFEFMRKESITSHVDMIKASMDAAFEMEAAIPQLIEAILYRCYENKGWDITTNKNSRYDDPFDPGTNAFPTLTDMLNTIEKVVDEQNFDDRLRNEYIGSIRARLQSLTVGAKGLMLDTPRSIDFFDLLDRKVVLELESIRNGSEKALIMGFILSAFNEAVRERYMGNSQERNHIILVEEAHRLLSKFMPGDSMNKKQGVEIFSDMLAEIRKYGESLIIVDQIPNKLAPDVLKNTNTKIIHRIFAQDDKEAVGNTMALKEDQKTFLSNLDVGRVILFSDDCGQAIQVQIQRDTDTGKKPPADKELTESVYEYYRKAEREIFMRVRKPLISLPTDLQEKGASFLRNDYPRRMIDQYRKNRKKQRWNKEYAQTLKELIKADFVNLDEVMDWLFRSGVIDRSIAGTEDAARLKEWFAAYEESEDAMQAVDVGSILG